MKKLLISGAVSIYIASTVLFCFLTVRWAEPSATQKEGGGFDMNATDLGVMCIGAAYPSMGIELADSRDNEGQPSQETDGTDTDLGGENGRDQSQGQDEQEPVVTGDDPLVLIVHTHATESYLPASSGNYLSLIHI